MKYYGLLLLGIWLIARSLLELLNVHFSYDKIVLACIALAAGVSLSTYELKEKLESIGILLLGIWLIMGAAIVLIKFTFPSSQLVMPILAFLAGLLLIVRR